MLVSVPAMPNLTQCMTMYDTELSLKALVFLTLIFIQWIFVEHSLYARNYSKYWGYTSEQNK